MIWDCWVINSHTNMSNNPLIDLYMSTLNEGVKSPEVKSVLKKDSEVFGKFPKGNDAEENVKKDLKKPTEDKEHSNADGSKGKPEKMKVTKESSNPFDKLFNQYLAEDFGDNFAPSTPDMGSNSGDLGGEVGGDIQSDELPITDENIDEDESEEAEGGIPGAIKALEQALAALKGIAGGEAEGEDLGDESEEGEEGEDDEFSWDVEDDGGDEEPVAGESVELTKAPDKKDAFQGATKSQVVTGAVPKKKGKASTPSTGKGNDGKLEKAPDKKDAFQGATKSQDTKGVKTGKFLFDQ